MADSVADSVTGSPSALNSRLGPLAYQPSPSQSVRYCTVPHALQLKILVFSIFSRHCLQPTHFLKPAKRQKYLQYGCGMKCLKRCRGLWRHWESKFGSTQERRSPPRNAGVHPSRSQLSNHILIESPPPWNTLCYRFSERGTPIC